MVTTAWTEGTGTAGTEGSPGGCPGRQQPGRPQTRSVRPALPDAREHHRGHDGSFPGVSAADRDDHEVIPNSQQVMQFQALPAMKKYTATALSRSREGAARPQQPPTKWAPVGAYKRSCCPHSAANRPLDRETRARGGTRTAFAPPQTLGSRRNIRNPARSGHRYDPARSPKCVLCTHFLFATFHATQSAA
jgi:hypothetical protein